MPAGQRAYDNSRWFEIETPVDMAANGYDNNAWHGQPSNGYDNMTVRFTIWHSRAAGQPALAKRKRGITALTQRG